MSNRDDVSTMHDMIDAWTIRLKSNGEWNGHCELERSRMMSSLARLEPLARVLQSCGDAGTLHHLANDETNVVELRSMLRSWMDVAVAYHARTNALEQIIEGVRHEIGEVRQVAVAARDAMCASPLVEKSRGAGGDVGGAWHDCACRSCEQIRREHAEKKETA